MVSERAFSDAEGVTNVRFDFLNQRLAVAGINGSFTVFFVDFDGKIASYPSACQTFSLP